MDRTWKDIEYRVFENKGIVLCKLWSCRYAAVDRINECAKLSEDDEINYLIDDVFVGVSSYAPGELDAGKTKALENAKKKKSRAIDEAVGHYIADIMLKYNNKKC